jgi:hypothetical protein
MWEFVSTLALVLVALMFIKTTKHQKKLDERPIGNYRLKSPFVQPSYLKVSPGNKIYCHSIEREPGRFGINRYHIVLLDGTTTHIYSNGSNIDSKYVTLKPE